MSDLYLTQLELPSGLTYDLVDAGARELISAINNWEYIVCSSAANTPKGVTWDNDGTTVTGTLDPSADTMYKIYLVPSENGSDDIFDEYITVNPSGSTYIWEMFGCTGMPDMTQYLKNQTGKEGSTAGDLAYKDTASGSTTVAVPATYTTSVTTATTSDESVSVTGTTAGSVSETKSAVTISAAGSGEATYTPAGSNADSAVTGTCAVTAAGSIGIGSGTANYTPAGSNEASSVSGSCAVTAEGTIGVGSGTANYTPAGNVSVATAGSTATIANPTAATVVTGMSVADASETTATGELAYFTVSGTKLTLKKIIETTGDSITTSDVTVKTGDASYSFSGTGVDLQFTGSSATGTISGTAAAQTFTGTGVDLEFTGSSASGTISGTAAGQTFTGTGARLVTDSQVLTGASFTGASMTSTGTVAVPATYTASTSTATTEDKTVSITVS